MNITTSIILGDSRCMKEVPNESVPDLIEIPVKTSDEPRFLVIGKITEKHWSGVITHRGEEIRLISVRRSRKEEVEIYKSS